MTPADLVVIIVFGTLALIGLGVWLEILYERAQRRGVEGERKEG